MILLIIPQAFSLLWNTLINQIYGSINNVFLSNLKETIFNDFSVYAFSTPIYFNLLIKFIIIGYIFSDFKKYQLKNLTLTILASFIYPILGVFILSVLFLYKKNEENKESFEYEFLDNPNIVESNQLDEKIK